MPAALTTLVKFEVWKRRGVDVVVISHVSGTVLHSVALDSTSEADELAAL